jgi:hypothetical protein
MKDNELKFEEVETSHTLRWSGFVFIIINKREIQVIHIIGNVHYRDSIYCNT